MYTPKSRIKCVHCSASLPLNEVPDHKYFCDGEGSGTEEDTSAQPAPISDGNQDEDQRDTSDEQGSPDLSSPSLLSPTPAEPSTTPSTTHPRRSLRLSRSSSSAVYQAINSSSEFVFG